MVTWAPGSTLLLFQIRLVIKCLVWKKLFPTRSILFILSPQMMPVTALMLRCSINIIFCEHWAYLLGLSMPRKKKKTARNNKKIDHIKR